MGRRDATRQQPAAAGKGIDAAANPHHRRASERPASPRRRSCDNHRQQQQQQQQQQRQQRKATPQKRPIHSPRYILYTPMPWRERPSQASTDKCVCLAIRMSVRHNEHPTASKNTRTPTPQPPAVGSSCTWRDKELYRFKVTVQRNVQPNGDMIPPKFFCFDGVPGYEQCICPLPQRHPLTCCCRCIRVMFLDRRTGN